MKYFSDRGKCTQKIQKGGGEKKMVVNRGSNGGIEFWEFLRGG